MNTPEPLVIVPGKLYRCKLLDHGWWVYDFNSGTSFQLPIGALLFCVRTCQKPGFLTPCGTIVETNIRVLDAWEEVSEP